MRIREILFEMSYVEAIRIWRDVGVVDPGNLAATQLKSTRNKLIQKYHPDLQGGNNEKAALINAAYDVLKAGTIFGGKKTTTNRSSSSSTRSSEPPYTRGAKMNPDDEQYAAWAQAGHSGGMPNQSSIYRNDYTDVNFIKKRMWELSKHSKKAWTIWGFDGAFLRGVTTVYGSPDIFPEMAKAMVMWQTKGANSYPCRAVLVHRKRHPFLLIWADGHDLPSPIEVEHDSFNDNPGNDPHFGSRLRAMLDKMQET